MRTSDPYAGSFHQITERGTTVRFEGKGECGMGGPTWGELDVPGLIQLDRAMPCLVIDEEQEVAAFQELDMSSTPRIVVHVLGLRSKQRSQHSIPFGAYVFTDAVPHRVVLTEQQSGESFEFEASK